MAKKQRSGFALTNDIHDDAYESKERFIAYYTQVNTLKGLHVKKVLNIGMGTGFLKKYFSDGPITILEADIDPALHPDVVMDISEKSGLKGTYDAVTAFQILEHIPFSKIDIALENMHRLSKKWAVISVPYRTMCFYFEMDFPLLKPRFKMEFERFFEPRVSNAHHQWELGLKGTGRKDFEKLILKWFKIEKAFTVDGNRSHYFYVLSKK